VGRVISYVVTVSLRRWLEYFNTRLNSKNRRRDFEVKKKVEGPMRQITEEEVVT